MSESANKERTTMIPQIARLHATHKDVEVYLKDEVDAALSAAAAQHQQEIAAKDAELDKLRATGDQQAETIRQLQATLPELHDAIERQSAQIAALTQERDEEARAFKRAAKDRDICRQKRVDLEARCATLTAALEQKEATEKREREKLHLEWSDRLGAVEPGWENKTVNMTNDQYSAFEAALLATQQSVCAALAVAPQGGTPNA